MKVTVVKCPICSTKVFSRTEDDIRYCLCGNIAVAGGPSAPKIIHENLVEGFSTITNYETNKSEEELYEDWNLCIDQLGVIPGFDI